MRCCSSGGCAPGRCLARRRGFTIVELIVLVAVMGLLVGLLIPALGASRQRAKAQDCAARLQQIGIATNLYLNDSGGALPQVLRVDAATGEARVSPLLFGGKRGTVARDGANQVGGGERPLNSYVARSANPTDAQLETFRSPADEGGDLPGVGRVASAFEAFGTSYAVNDRLLRESPGEPPVATLIPAAGGAMPKVTTPAQTWMLGSHPIHNFDIGHDHQFRWYGGIEVKANLLMVDMHSQSQVPVATGAMQTTETYTFKPMPNWPAP